MNNPERRPKEKLLKPLFGSIAYTDYESLIERIECLEKRSDEIARRLGLVAPPPPTLEEVERQKEDNL